MELFYLSSTWHGKGLRLLITDHLEWSDEVNHLLVLQEKINAYIGFCENHQYNQVYTNREWSELV